MHREPLMELDPESFKFLDGLDEVLLEDLLDSAADSTGFDTDATNTYMDLAGFHVIEEEQLTLSGTDDRAVQGAQIECTPSSSSSSSSSALENIQKQGGNAVDDLIDLADVFQVYEDDKLESVGHDCRRPSMDSRMREDTLISGQAQGRSSSNFPSPNNKRKGDEIADEQPSKRQQRVEDSDSKRQQRLVRNRNSAALSRWRKRAGMEALEKRNTELERANARLSYLLASASMENQALRAALVDRGGVDTVKDQGMTAVGEPAVLSQCIQPMYAGCLKKHNSLQLEYQQSPCVTASHLRRTPVRYAALLLLSLHLQYCQSHDWSHADDKNAAVGQFVDKMRCVFNGSSSRFRSKGRVDRQRRSRALKRKRTRRINSVLTIKKHRQKSLIM